MSGLLASLTPPRSPILSAIATIRCLFIALHTWVAIPTLKMALFDALVSICALMRAKKAPQMGRLRPTFQVNVWYAGSDPSSESGRALDFMKT